MSQYAPLVSIILPAYNSEQCLKNAVASVISQTYQNWELIIVDDGSSDETGKIAKELSGYDCRIRSFSQQNGGVSSARNQGLDQALGNWVTFLDADDAIEPSFLKALIDRAAACADIDIVIGGAKLIGRKKRLYKNQSCATLQGDDIKSLSMSIIDCEIHGDFGYSLPVLGYVWSKLYRKSSVEGIKFDPRISMREDAVFNLEAFCRARTIALSDSCGYLYWQDSGSASRSFHPSFDKEVRALLEAFRAVSEREHFPDQVISLGTIRVYMTWLKLFALHPQNGFSRSEQRSILGQSLRDERWRRAFGSISSKTLSAPYRALRLAYLARSLISIRMLKALNDLRKIAR